MGWRASLSDEHAVHQDELSRQDLVQQQQSELADTQLVDSYMTQFGTFAEDSLLARSLRQDAPRVDHNNAQTMLSEAQVDLNLARNIGRQIGFTYPAAAPYVNPDGSYEPQKGSAFDFAQTLAFVESADETLHGLDPDQLRAQARSQRLLGLHLTGIAALFVSALVFLTLAAVSRGTRARWFASLGGLVAGVALVLFALVDLF